MIRLSVLFVLSILLFSCKPSPVVSIDQKIENTWTYDQPLEYIFDVTDAEAYYDLILSISYATDFSYQNIYVNIKTTYPSKEKTEDILSLNISDGFGSFLGKCNSDICTTDIALQNKFKFEEAGSYTIQVFQNGRERSLEGVKGGKLQLYKIQA